MTGRRISFPEYVDWLYELRQNGAMKFVTQKRDFPLNTLFSNPRSYHEIFSDVLNSPRVSEAIADESARSGHPVSKVKEEAKGILKMMAHNFGVSSTRAFGYFVVKVLERIFDAIYVNAEQMKRVRELCRSEPVVFMPSHRTYLDFLLLSILCFEYEVPLPAIAASMDFTNSWFMSEVLRRSGAFYIRRSIGQDKLYWAILSEYVQTHIINCDRPVEFFIEGTRSRVGKSVYPKYGLLQMVLEPFLKREVYDIIVVPVTTNYDRLLEELPYSYELLGYPKPKESTADQTLGLIKARNFLNKRFGRCFVTFGEPISIREYFGTALHRSGFVRQPSSQYVLSEVQRGTMKRFAHAIIEILDRNAVITIWSLACAAMTQRLDDNDEAIFVYAQIYHDVLKLLRLLEAMQVVVHIAGSVHEELRYYINLHSELFEPMDTKAENFSLKLVKFPVLQAGKLGRDIMERSVSRLLLSTYSNMMLHSVCTTGCIAAIILRLKVIEVEELERQYRYLQKLLEREFIHIPGDESKSFQRTLCLLKKAKIIEVSSNRVNVRKQEELSMLQNLISPCILNFQLVLEALLTTNLSIYLPADVISVSQKFIADNYLTSSQNSIRLSFLSAEPIKNATLMFVGERVLTSTDGGYILNRSNALKLLHDLSAITGSQPIGQISKL
ncbi:hypothetical protein Angca_008277 [Angiostrongylus cantonensis]|nr:hypothetical protein Angca_008277 [Angiostrongylus cantonensis]